MTVFRIRTFGDPVLRQTLRVVDPTEADLPALVQNMAETMYDAPGVGLAANQIGVLKQIFVYDDGEGEGLRAYMNPVLEEGEGEVIDEEGCLSVGGIQAPVKRYERVKIRVTNMDGEEELIEAEGLLARILQHEIDHLNGMTILDRLDDDIKRQVISEFHEKEGLV